MTYRFLWQNYIASFILIVVGFSAPAFAQTQKLGSEVAPPPLMAVLSDIHSKGARANSLQNIKTLKSETDAFQELVKSLLENNTEEAQRHAQKSRYKLQRLSTVSGDVLIASDKRTPSLHPTLIIHTKPKYNLVVGAPHTSYEDGTLGQAAFLVERGAARGAIIATAHRCAASQKVTCDGKTKVCGGKKSRYSVSDVAHNPNSYFHKAHVLFAQAWPGSLFFSLHGMRRDKSGVRTSLILSSGYKQKNLPATAPASILRKKLKAILPKPGRVVSCNTKSDRQYKYRKICGFSNVQGRFLNNSKNACKGNLKTGTDRFIHIEQDWSIRSSLSKNKPPNSPSKIQRQVLEAYLEISEKL